MKDCDLGGYNIIHFDTPMLQEHFIKCDIIFPVANTNMIDAYKIFKHYHPHTLAGAVKEYLGKNHDNAHRAEDDTIASLEVFIEQSGRYKDFPANIEDLHLMCTGGDNVVDLDGKISINENGEYVFTFGKNKGKKIRDNADYVAWMLNADFTIDTKNKLKEIMFNKT